jgi:hypothetical protein
MMNLLKKVKRIAWINNSSVKEKYNRRSLTGSKAWNKWKFESINQDYEENIKRDYEEYIQKDYESKINIQISNNDNNDDMLDDNMLDIRGHGQ